MIFESKKPEPKPIVVIEAPKSRNDSAQVITISEVEEIKEQPAFKAERVPKSKRNQFKRPPSKRPEWNCEVYVSDTRVDETMIT